MISYAQNAEDVVLARALPTRTGFYVDVGAADPDIASVTKHFYDLGWSGINIDARLDAVNRLTQHRPRDVNLHLAAYSSDGVLTFHEDDDDPDQSTIENSSAEVLITSGHHLRTEQVPARTLNSILAEHTPTGVPIEFLKIDVEGAEPAVLAGLDLTRWRPKIIVIEAVKPWSTERTDHRWRHHLDDNGYAEALFDGLNLFFIAQEQVPQIGPLPPASVLDQYTHASVELLNAEITRLRDYIGTLRDELERHQGATDPGRSGGPRHRMAAHHEDGGAVIDPAPGFLVVGPLESTARLAGQLAAALNTTPRAAAHPADIDWDSLAEREVVQLDWPPSRHLLDLARLHHLQPVVPEPGGEPGEHRQAWLHRPGTLAEKNLPPGLLELR